MNQSFRIPSSKWWLTIPILMLLMAAPGTFWRYSDFIDEPSLKTGLMLLSWPLWFGFCTFMGVRQLCTTEVISFSNGGIQFHRTIFSRIQPSEAITTVTQDQIAFHLYSKKDQMSISKKRVPFELAQILDERIAADKEPNEMLR